MKKKSFILFKDQLCVLDELTNEQTGKLFKLIYKFQTGKKDYKLKKTDKDYKLINVAAVSIIAGFNRENEKYIQTCLKNKKNAARQKKAVIQQKPKQDKEIELKTPKLLIDNNLPIFHKIILYLNKKTGSRCRVNTKKYHQYIKARLKEGYNLNDFYDVIDNKTEQWKGSELEHYLRPETLFSDKFAGYLPKLKTNNGFNCVVYKEKNGTFHKVSIEHYKKNKKQINKMGSEYPPRYRNIPEGTTPARNNYFKDNQDYLKFKQYQKTGGNITNYYIK